MHALLLLLLTGALQCTQKKTVSNIRFLQIVIKGSNDVVCSQV
jgi:hypothetical protein